jgi:hypothetical protein
LPPGGGGGGESNGPSSPDAAPTASRALSHGLAGWRAAVALGAAFGLGAAAHSAVAPKPAVVYVDRPALAVVPAPEPARPDAGHASIAVTDLPLAPASSAPAGAPAQRDPSNRGLASERALLDVARTALANGESAPALAAVLRHEKEYPKGALVEEREALAIKALVLAARYDEARTRAARYQRAFPNGLMQPAVESALRTIP